MSETLHWTKILRVAELGRVAWMNVGRVSPLLFLPNEDHSNGKRLDGQAGCRTSSSHSLHQVERMYR